MKFTGKERDAETGLDYFLARYLSSPQGRFTSTDPASGWPSDPQSWNMYAYARNNPLLYTDPDGETYRVCQIGSDGKETNCTEQKNELTDKQFESFKKDSKGTQIFAGGKIYGVNEDGTRGTQTGTYKQTDVDLGDAGQQLFQGNRQLWNTSSTVIDATAAATGGLMMLPVAAEIVALPTMEVAVGKFVGSWHVGYQATGGPWLHGMRLGGAGVEVTSAAAGEFAKRALFRFSLKILRPGAVSGTAGAAAGNCAFAACNAFLKGWGLK